MAALLTGSKNNLGHRWMRLAALLGACFVVAHIVTVVVTCTVDGIHWGVNAWLLDIAGFIAGLFFATQCWLSSGKTCEEFWKGNLWIVFWASVTLAVRFFDTLMLFGVVKWSAIYVTPHGAVLWSNVISEVVFGITFASAALVAALMILKTRTTASGSSDLDSQ